MYDYHYYMYWCFNFWMTYQEEHKNHLRFNAPKPVPRNLRAMRSVNRNS